MALTKTFAAGQILTANDVNTHLAHQVPNAGDPYDTGWVNIPGVEGFISSAFVRRIGLILYFRGLISGTLAANTNTVVAVSPLTPGHQAHAAPATTGGHWRPTISIHTDGRIHISSPIAITSTFYVTPLSGTPAN